MLCLLGLMLALSSGLSAQKKDKLEADTLGKVLVEDVVYDGNKRTVQRILERELTFAPGDSIYRIRLKDELEQSENNLMNLRLFNFVTLEALPIGDDRVLVLLTVQERWYIYPAPILQIAETNFNTWWENRELRWLNYGASINHDNFRGRNERLSIMARFGYTRRFSTSYSIPNLNKKQTLGIEVAAGYFENNELVYTTLGNQRQFYNNPEDKARRWMEYRVGLVYRENIFTRHGFSLSFHSVTVNDTIPILNEDYLPVAGNTAQFFRLNYNVNHDTRDYKRYPLKGLLLYAFVQQDGLGIMDPNGMNLLTTQAGYRHYHKLGDRTFLAYALTGKVNWSEPPYYLINALGYNDFVRGYEFFVIDGSRFALLQSNFKYQILQPKTFTLPFVPEQFAESFIALYGNLFFDAGYVYGPEFVENNSLVNEYLYSIGLGLDVVTYYDKVMRVEGSLNGLGQKAVFVHFRQAF